jgi:hypothetical protein
MVAALAVAVTAAPATAAAHWSASYSRSILAERYLVCDDDDRLDAEAGGELDLVDRRDRGRVGDAEEQPLAAPEQRQHAVLGDQLVGGELDDVEVDDHRVEVDQRYAELAGGGDRDVARGDHPLGDQLRDHAGALVLGIGGGLGHGRLVDETILHESLGQSPQARAGSPADCQRSVIVHVLARWSE